MEATCPNLNISQLDIITISEPVVVIAGLAGSDSGDSTHHTAALEKQRSQGTSGNFMSRWSWQAQKSGFEPANPAILQGTPTRKLDGGNVTSGTTIRQACGSNTRTREETAVNPVLNVRAVRHK